MPSEARAVAFSVVRRVFADGAYADRALPAEADRAGLDARDRALATRLAYGTVQRKGTLDHLLARLAERPVARLDPPVLAAARLGLYQLLYLDGVPDRAAVAESVDLAKGAAGRGAAGLVNAVLRRAAREGRDALLGPLHDRDPAGAALLHSVPLWLAEQWWAELGPEPARALLAAANEPAEHALRANTLVSDRDAVAAALGVPSRTDPVVPEALVLEGPFDLRGSAQHGVDEPGRATPGHGLGQVDALGHRRAVGNAVEIEDLVEAEPRRRHHRRVEPLHRPLGQPGKQVVERGLALDGPVRQTGGQRAVAGVEPGPVGLGGQRPVRVGAGLEHAPDDGERDPARVRGHGRAGRPQPPSAARPGAGPRAVPAPPRRSRRRARRRAPPARRARRRRRPRG